MPGDGVFGTDGGTWTVVHGGVTAKIEFHDKLVACLCMRLLASGWMKLDNSGMMVPIQERRAA